METFRHILQTAVDAGASDVHIKAGAPIMFRIARELVTVDAPAPTPAWLTNLLQQIVPEPQRLQLESEREVDLAIEVDGIGRFRTNIYQQRGRLVVALRIVKQQVRTFEELHLPPALRRIAEGRAGIVIIAGAPGSGKSTTLAAILEHLNNTVRKHIITLEDPIEYVLQDKLCVFEQREVGLDTASFATGLRNVLRQDPDVLVIGEMRDAASALAAVAAANVGTLVLTTLHTGDASNSIQRILQLFSSEDREHARRQLSGTLRAVVCQKLVKSNQGEVLPATEILINTAGVRKLLEENEIDKLQGVMELGSGDGMQTFDQCLLKLVDSGTISQAEALAHAPNPEALRMKLQGVFLNETRRILNVRD